MTGEHHHGTAIPVPGTPPAHPIPPAAERGGRSGTHCPHLPGRIVVCGAKLKRSIVPNSAAIYNFQRAFQLEQEEVSWACKPRAQIGTKAELPRAAPAVGLLTSVQD